MLMFTLGKVDRDELDWVVELHSKGEIRVTCAELCAARLWLGPGGVLGPIEPEPEWVEPVERMDLLRQDVVDVLAFNGREGRGPWAGLDAGL